MGAFNLAGLLEGLEGFSMALFTRVLGKSPDEVQVFLMDVRKELRDPKIHTVRFSQELFSTTSSAFAES